jgi:bifunctional non-homologous end joining protein LigD
LIPILVLVLTPTVLEASLNDLIRYVKTLRLEGIVAKRIDSRYKPGRRSGAWQKMRVNQGQKFVIGGYTPSGRNFDAIVFGYNNAEGRLVYAARTRNGFTGPPETSCSGSSRAWKRPDVHSPTCLRARSGRWGEGLTAEQRKDCRSLQPVLAGQF